MSMEERGKRLKSELGWISGSLRKRLKESGSSSRGKRLKESLEEKGKRLKSEAELERKQKLQKLEMDHGDSTIPYMRWLGDYVYTNKAWRKMESEMAFWRDRNRHISAYDADLVTPPPLMDEIFAPCGGSAPFHITDDNRPTLITHCELALEYFNRKNNYQAPTFVFHQLVKCATGGTGPGELYYITFQAKAEEENEDLSNSPAITFQTRVWHGKNEAPEVQKCDIKI